MTRNKWKFIGISQYYSTREASFAIEKNQLIALDRVTFTQSYGEIVGIIGGEGAGKSTFGRVLLETLTPSEGLISGRTDKGACLCLPDRRQEERTGASHARHRLLDWGVPKKKVPGMMVAIQEFSDLGGQFERRIRLYSTAEKIQLEISILLHLAPTLIYIDESLLIVKEHFYVKILLFLTQLKELGSSIWIETDTVKRIEPFCDKLLWLEFGKLQKHGDVMEVLTHYDAYYFNILRLLPKQQLDFWEEGYQSQVTADDEKALTGNPMPQVFNSSIIVEDAGIDSIFPETSSRNSVTVPTPSRIQRKKMAFRLGYPWVLGGVGGLGIVCSILFVVFNSPIVREGSQIKVAKTPSTSVEAKESSSKTSNPLNSEGVTKVEETKDGNYVVKEGELLTQIAERFNVSVDQLRQWNHLTKDELEPNMNLQISENSEEIIGFSATPPVATFSHNVVSGESVTIIADKYGVTVADLLAVNQVEGDAIYAGTTLLLPIMAETKHGSDVPAITVPTVTPEAEVLPETSRNYVVVQGDTLYSVAKSYGVTVMVIQEENYLQSEQLYPGQVLVIP